jgi:hypothetical protein
MKGIPSTSGISCSAFKLGEAADNSAHPSAGFG